MAAACEHSSFVISLQISSLPNQRRFFYLRTLSLFLENLLYFDDSYSLSSRLILFQAIPKSLIPFNFEIEQLKDCSPSLICILPVDLALFIPF